MPAMFASRSWRWMSKAILLALAVAIPLLSRPQKLEPAEQFAPRPKPVARVVQDQPSLLFAIDDEVIDDPAPAAIPATKPSTAPFLRGLYTGAARTSIDSSGRSRVIWMEVTAYCPCPICCGPRAAGVTSSGKPVTYNDGAFVAADADRFPFNTKLSIPGYHNGDTVEVQDRGSSILGPRLDVFFPTHEEAAAWGRQWLAVTVEE